MTHEDLIAVAVQLGADTVPGWSPQERALASQIAAAGGSARRRNHRACALARTAARVREQIQAGEDPLGHAFIQLRPAAVRRGLGATYTPDGVVRSMVQWASEQGVPERIVDPGVGSGRFLLRAAAAFPGSALVGIEIDPLAALMARANLAAAGFADRARVDLADYRSIDLRSDKRTLYVGNPPYVRHHLIDSNWKDWLRRQWQSLGIKPSRLAGLHLYFFLATLMNSRAGDYGAFITAAEWLDVNYGEALRTSFLEHLGGVGLIGIEPTAEAFPDAATTAAITLFKVGTRAGFIRVASVASLGKLGNLAGGEPVSRRFFEAQSRWSRLVRSPRDGDRGWRSDRRRPSGFVELGELCRVHRGQATGANAVWIVSETLDGVAGRLPDDLLFPTVTRARDLILAGKRLADPGRLRKVVDLPEDLGEIDPGARDAVEGFLCHAREHGAHVSYLARHRRAWWSVALRAPAPILATYMARRPPVFTHNPHGARHLNIAHGLYPREPLSDEQLTALVDYLSGSVSVADGRTYAGGLTKFEPREMERLVVPGPRLLVPRALRRAAGAAAGFRAAGVGVRRGESDRASQRR